jgi:hypothetical protein
MLRDFKDLIFLLTLVVRMPDYFGCRNSCHLQSVHNFAARIMSGTRKFDHVTPILKQLNWLLVKLMLSYRNGVLAFKCVKGLTQGYLSDRFNMRSIIHTSNTRNKDLLNIPEYKSAAGQQTFLYRAASLWNSLPRSLKESASINNFKRDYKIKKSSTGCEAHWDVCEMHYISTPLLLL